VSALRHDLASRVKRAEIDGRYGYAIQRVLAGDDPNPTKWIRIAALDRGRWNEYRDAGLVEQEAKVDGGQGLTLDDPMWDRVQT